MNLDLSNLLRNAENTFDQVLHKYSNKVSTYEGRCPLFRVFLFKTKPPVLQKKWGDTYRGHCLLFRVYLFKDTSPLRVQVPAISSIGTLEHFISNLNRLRSNLLENSGNIIEQV